ncbi:MAG TPA: T9SS type A sorting domain-containing protein, partial [Bacteroidetes bacterium]|nr:T9SS type A sorting domain-containing protein [Bacteroidota bacterium]
MKRHITKLLLLLLFINVTATNLYPQNWDWSNHISGTDNIFSKDILLDSEGNIIVAVQIKGEATIIGTDPLVIENAGANTPILMKFDENGTLIWHVKIGDLDANNLNSIATDNLDNIYIAGGFTSANAACTFGSTDGNTISITGDGQDTYIAKYNSYGVLQWAKNVATSTALCRAEGLTLDSENNILINGLFRGGAGTIIDFGEGNTFEYIGSTNLGNAFVAKFNNSGDFIWAKHFSSNINVRGSSIAQATTEGSYALFAIEGEFTFEGTDPLISLADGSLRWAIIKLDNDGNPLWLRTVNTSAQSTIVTQSLTSNNQGDVFIGGSVSGATFLTNSDELDEIPLTSNGSFDIFGAMYNSDGDIVWAKSFGSTSIDRTIGIAANSDQFSIYGLNANVIYIENDTIPLPTPTYGVFNVIFDYYGNLLSQTALSPVASPDRDGAISIDENGNSYIAGFFSSASLDIGTNTLTNGGGKDAFIAKHTSIHVLPQITPLSCHNGSNGAMSFTISGGADEPYTYIFRKVDEGIIDQGTYSAPLTYENLTNGTYAIDIEDASGRSISKYYSIDNPPQITISETIVDVSQCYGYQNGEILLAVNGGTGNYSFLWDTENGYGLTPTTQDQNSLTAGIYSVLVTDENGCTASETFTVNQPDKIIFNQSTVTSNTDNNPDTPNGEINLEVTNAILPITTFLWDGPNGFTADYEDLTSIKGGTYNVNITDANGCIADTSFHVIDENLFYIWISDKHEPECRGGNNGTATVSWANNQVTDGITVEWIDGQQTQTATNLSAGTYSVTVTNDNSTPEVEDDIQITVQVVIHEPDYPFSISHIATPTSCPNDADGSILLQVNGWYSPYSYEWSTENGSGLMNGQKDQENLTAGDYTVVVTDANGCARTRNINIAFSYPEPDVTLSADPGFSICTGSSIDITAEGAHQYQFFIDEVTQGEFSTVNTLAIPSPTDGMVVRVIGMNTAGCTSENEAVITVNPIPAPTISTDDPTEWTEGEAISVLFTVDIESADSYQWLLNGEPITDAISDTYTASQEGAFSAEVTVLGCLGLSNEIAITVVPLKTYTVTFTVTNSSQIAVENADITVTGYDVITTNASGEATIELPNNTYTFEISANDYQLYTGGFEVNDANVTVPVQLVGVGIDSNQLHNVNAYPNPFSNQLNITNTDVVKRVVIANITGQKVVDVTLDGKNEVSTQGVQPGVY